MTNRDMDQNAEPPDAMFAPNVSRTPECDVFADRLGAYIERELSSADQATMDAHLVDCVACADWVRDIQGIVAEAGVMVPLAPSLDLWSGIESRLDTAVVPIASRTAVAARDIARDAAQGRHMSVRHFAIAAALLVAVSSAVTWRIVRTAPVRSRAPVELASSRNEAVVPTVNALTAADTALTLEPIVAPTRLVARSPADVENMYVQEIADLRMLVDLRSADLDSVTVVALRRNLAIIDQAIADSRRALKRSPKSRVLSSQLDHALETKLALMRRVALL